MKLNKVGDVVTHPKKLKGEWVVTETRMTGGGMGGYGPQDIYPDGHQLTLQRLVEGTNEFAKGKAKKFYQSGCFISEVMIDYMKPIRKVKLKMVIE